ncbi:unnamed protein product, partial [marine sediment metagenome]
MTREPFRARLYPKDALLGRLDGAKTSPALLVNPRRILHLFLVLLIAGGVSLFFLLGPPGGGGQSTTPELAISQGLELDGNVTRDGDDEIITIAGPSIKPMHQAVPVDSDGEIITIAAVSI